MILIIENFFSKQIIKTDDALSIMKNIGVYRNIWINTFNIPHIMYDHKCPFISLSKMRYKLAESHKIFYIFRSVSLIKYFFIIYQ